MRTAYAVIGANYGDEGKGQVTAWLCRRLHEIYPEAKVLNVLTNGGCQRGHTVNIPERKFRHVFKHFGSGTPYGAHTHFGPEFIVNPMQFVKEFSELKHLGLDPVVSCGWYNRVQLPVDMAVNQYLEQRRSENGMEHGSVGFGINETILRYERGKGSSIVDLAALAGFKPNTLLCGDILRLESAYAKERILEEIGSNEAVDDFSRRFSDVMSEGTARHFVDDLAFMSRNIEMGDHAARAHDHDFFVFENGQGLKIGQQESTSLYHCTPSDTGAFSVLRAMSDMKLIGCNADHRTRVDRVVPVYVTRTYMTRHGAGELDGRAVDSPPLGEELDATNVPNDFQGSMRYSEFTDETDFYPMVHDISKFMETCTGCKVRRKLAVTHAGNGSMEGLAHFLPFAPNVTFSADQPEEFEMDSDFFQPNNNKPPCIR